MIIIKHVWPDGILAWEATDSAGNPVAFFWSAQQAADFAEGKNVTFKIQHHEH